MSDATAQDEDVVTNVAQRLSALDPRAYKLIFYGVLFIWMAWLMVSAWGWSWANKLVPLFAGIPTLALLVLKLVQIVFPERYARVMPTGESTESQAAAGSDGEADLEDSYQKIRAESDEDTRPQSAQIAYALRMLGWAMGLPVLMYLIGFANALVLFVLAFGLRYFDSVRDTVIVTVVFSVLMYLFFWEIIGLNPWTGTFGVPSIVRLLGLG